MKSLMLIMITLLVFVGVFILNANSYNRADINHDGKVNDLDLSIVLENWSK